MFTLLSEKSSTVLYIYICIPAISCKIKKKIIRNITCTQFIQAIIKLMVETPQIISKRKMQLKFQIQQSL